MTDLLFGCKQSKHENGHIQVNKCQAEDPELTTSVPFLLSPSKFSELKSCATQHMETTQWKWAKQGKDEMTSCPVFWIMVELALANVRYWKYSIVKYLSWVSGLVHSYMNMPCLTKVTKEYFSHQLIEILIPTMVGSVSWFEGRQ